MFTFNPDLAKDDAYEEGDEAFDSYSKNEEEDDDAQVRNDALVHFHLSRFKYFHFIVSAMSIRYRTQIFVRRYRGRYLSCNKNGRLDLFAASLGTRCS